MTNDKQIENEHNLIQLLRGKQPKVKSKIEQLRADVADIARAKAVGG